jgi:hypothetical protein
VANKFAYLENLRGCDVEVLDEVNSKFNEKLDEINSKFNKNDELILTSRKEST